MSNHNKDLSPGQDYVLNKKGTEMPFSGVLNTNKKTGNYICGKCGTELFSSKTKFDSGSGWPSFYDATNNSVKLIEDNSAGMIRTEVICATCGGHLGHVFEDGPASTTGLRYCINSAALNFTSEDGTELIRGDGQD